MKQIEIVQKILKEKNRFDLAIKLENAYYDEILIDGYGNGIGILDIFVNPYHYLYFQAIDENDKELLLNIFKGLKFNDFDILNDIEFKINENIFISDITNITYIFVDEAGDMDFSANGSKHYMFSFLVKKRPFALHEKIASYRYSLLERNLDPLNEKRLDIEYFHACEDNKFIKNKMFDLISNFDEQKIKIYSYVLEKPKVLPQKRAEKGEFYTANLTFATSRLLDKLKIDNNFIIITDRLPVQKNKNNQISAIKKGIKQYIKSGDLNIRYDIFHHSSASSVNLQIVDYINWAIFRKYEKGDESFYDKIKRYILDEEVLTKDRDEKFY